MKTNYLLLIFASLLVGCGSKNRVTHVEYDFAKQKTTLKGEKTNKEGKVDIEEVPVPSETAFVREDDVVNVVVKSYNPYRHVLKVQMGTNVLFYTNNEPKLIMENISTVLTPATVEAFESSASTFAPASRQQCITSDPTANLRQKILKDVGNFKALYDKVQQINTVINRNKQAPTINPKKYYCELNMAVHKAEEVLGNEISDPIPACQGETDDYKAGGEVDKISSWMETTNKELSANIKLLRTSLGRISVNCPIQLDVAKKVLEAAESFSSELSTKIVEIDKVFSELKRVSTLQFDGHYGNYKVGETDVFTLKLEAGDIITNEKIPHTIAELPVKKWLKIDFSAGMFHTWLYDQSFTKTKEPIVTDPDANPVATEDRYTLHYNNGGGQTFGAIGFVNFHTQVPGSFNAGISLGTGLRFNESTKVVLAPTVSLIFGKSQRLIVHAGAAFSKVDRMYSVYGNETFTDADYTPETKQELWSALLIGISWNISRSK